MKRIQHKDVIDIIEKAGRHMMDDVRIHRVDCQGFDERINCIGCFKAEAMEVLRAAHDHMLMDKTGRGPASRAFKMAESFLDLYDHRHGQ